VPIGQVACCAAHLARALKALLYSPIQVCWDMSPLLVAPFVIVFAAIEGLLLSANVVKIPEGGWVALLIAFVVCSLKLIWW
jgi:K+ transporter